MHPLQAKRILLGVTGSIAAYKAADLASQLTQAGAAVEVILTQSAAQFISPLTFQSVTGQRVYQDTDRRNQSGHIVQVESGRKADACVIAPGTAHTMAKLAAGQADNLLTTTALAISSPLILAPALDGDMYSHPATQANLETLQGRGVHILGPGSGGLAGMKGTGRMVEPPEIMAFLRWLLSRPGPLAERHVVVTAGGTEEPFDPVRAITNRSTGKQGFALAQAALDLGARVTLISGPTHLPAPYGANRIPIKTAVEMSEEVMKAITGADVLLMAAAVADFRPVQISSQKIKKEAGPPRIELQANPDILTRVAAYKREHGRPCVVIGFAGESADLLGNARRKLQAKALDLIVANDLTASEAGFEADTNRVTLLRGDGNLQPLPLQSKTAVAERVLDEVTSMLKARSA